MDHDVRQEHEEVTIRTKEAVEAAFRLRDKVLCEYCGHQILADAPEADPHRAVGDHRIPISRGGTHARTNISVVCYHCNKRKGPLTLAEFIAHFHDDQALAYMRTHVTNGLRDGTTVTLPTRWQRPPAPGTHESDMHYRRRVTSEHTADNAEWVRAAAWSRIEARKPD